MTRRSFIAAAALATCVALSFTVTLPAHAQDITVGTLKISAPWARATPKGANVGGGYLTITNIGGTADRLVGGSSDISSRFEVHEMSMDNGVMKMRMLPKGLDIKPGETVALKPGGYHIMFVGLKQQLEPGRHFKVTLQFEKAGTVDVDFPVAGIGAPAPGGGHDTPGMKMKH